MYKPKSEIIGQIQSYHAQVAKLYREIYEKTEDDKMRSLISDLYELEKSREDYLEKHRKIAEAMNCYLDFPCEKLSNQIAECLNEVHAGCTMAIEDLIKLEIHFDNCLIKLYNILASEDRLSETVTNIFYYMLKKTKKEETTLAGLLCSSRSKVHLRVSAPMV
ncbi:MAG TPA: hypothetical protein PKI34_08485 [Bacteroidales bacterium]|nr:hypothetical protein [Bacteroidales bacterium]